MTKTYHFLAGLPRSGSTLLANILLQNPRFHATSTSGIPDLLLSVRNGWENVAPFRANPNRAAKMRVLRGIIDAYYSDIDKPVIVDKSRLWPAAIEMIEAMLGQPVKIIVSVRDMRDVIASFERLWRENAKSRQIPQEKGQAIKFQTLKGRCEVWLSPQQPVGASYNNIVDAIARGYRDRMFFLDFNELTNAPAESMAKLYEFLGESAYLDHNFDNVEQITKEDDSVYGFDDLHTIRQRVEPLPAQWPKYLGEFGNRFSQLNFWKIGAAEN